MSYSRRQLEALGEPFGSCATRVKPGGYGRIYGLGNEPEPEGSRPSGEDYYYQTGALGQPAGFMVKNPEYQADVPAYVPYTGDGRPSGEDYIYQNSIGQPSGFMVPNPEYKGAEYVPYVQPTSTAAAASSGGGGDGGAAPNVQQQTAQLLQEKLGTAPTQDQINYWGGIFGQDNKITSDEVARLDAAIGNTGKTPGTSPVGNAIVSGGGGATTTGGGGAATTTGGNVTAQTTQLLQDRLQTTPTQDQINYWSGIFGLDNVITPDEVTRLDAAIGNTGKTPGPSTIADTILATQQSQQQQQQQQQQQVNQGGQQTTTTGTGGFLGAPFAGGQAYNPFYAGPDARSDLVNMAYQRLLNRQPDTGGLASYSQEMIKGLTGQGLVSALARSPEFQRTQDFQRAYTSTFRPGYQEFGPTGQYNQPIYLGNYTNYARSPEFAQPLYNTTMMTPQDLGYGFGSFNPFAYGGTNQFAGDTAAPTGSTATGGGSTAAARGGRIKNDDGIAALLKR